MTIHNHFACPRGIFIKNSLGIIPKERQRNDEESHTMFTNLPHQCFWKSSTRCSGWDASFIGMTYCPACHSDRATKERRGIPHHAHVNLLTNVAEKAVRDAKYGMPLLSAWQKRSENVIPTVGGIPHHAHVTIVRNVPEKAVCDALDGSLFYRHDILPGLSFRKSDKGATRNPTSS